MTRISFAVIFLLAVTATGSSGFPTLYVDDSSGLLGTVDVATGNASVIGDMGYLMTDIAFSPTGELWGITFNDIFKIDKTTGQSTLVGSHGISSGNALVFGQDGTLYAAGGGESGLYTIDTATGGGSLMGDIGWNSAGDLAFYGDDLYLSSMTNDLIKIGLDGGVTGTYVGPFGYSAVFGLARAENQVMYGVAGTDIFSVDLNTGTGTFQSDFSGQGLGAAYGSTFFGEAVPAVPEPSTVALLGGGLLGLVFLERRRRRR